MIPRPPRSTLCPCTTLSRSVAEAVAEVDGDSGAVEVAGPVEQVGLDAQVLTAEGRVHADVRGARSEEHTSELQSRQYLVCSLLLEKKKSVNTSDLVPPPKQQ